MNIISVKLNKKQQIEQRRALILELSSQGMSQEKIADILKPDVLKISQSVVSRDLEYLKENRIEYVKKNREQMVEEYQKTFVNLKTLRRDVFGYYRKARDDDNVELVMKLVPIIQSIEHTIHELVAAGDLIEAELIHHGQIAGKEAEDRVNKMVANARF
jgi:predicted transcriptional regulator